MSLTTDERIRILVKAWSPPGDFTEKDINEFMPLFHKYYELAGQLINADKFAAPAYGIAAAMSFAIGQMENGDADIGADEFAACMRRLYVATQRVFKDMRDEREKAAKTLVTIPGSEKN